MKLKVDSNLQMIYEVLKTGECIDSVVTAALKPFKITHPQYNILRILYIAQPDPLFVGELKSKLLFTNSDVTRLLDRMVKRGIINRKVSENSRRNVEILINAKGLELLKECTLEIEKSLHHDYLEKIIPLKDAEMVSETLSKLREELCGVSN